jgi:hypothetical protein
MESFSQTGYLFLSDVMDDLYKWINPKTKKHSPMISEDIHKIIKDNQDVSLFKNLYLKQVLSNSTWGVRGYVATSHLPFVAVGWNPQMDVGFFLTRKLSS